MGRRGRPPYPDILTPREWEVLALLRENLTNEAIAARLGVTHAAAKYHVSEILSKLGVASREEAAAWEPARELAEAGKPRLRRWWGAGLGWLRPVTVGKAALIGAAVAVVAGLGVLAWGVLRTSGDETALVVAASPTAIRTGLGPTARSTATLTASPSPGPPVVIQAGDWQQALESVRCGTIEHDTLAPGIYTMDVESCEPQLLTDGAEDSGVAWSPDGIRLAFLRREGPASAGISADVYVVEVGGGQPRQITATPNVDETAISWSPDGTLLAFGSRAAGVWNAGYDLVLANPDRAGESRVLLAGQGTADRAWSPDGQRIAVSTGYDGRLIVVAVESGAAVTIASDATQGLAWSPDGTTIAYNCQVREDFEDPEPRLCLSNHDGGNHRVLLAPWGPSSFADRSGGPRWTPDDMILLTGFTDGKLHFVDPKSGHEVKVVENAGPFTSFALRGNATVTGSVCVGNTVPCGASAELLLDLNTGDVTALATTGCAIGFQFAPAGNVVAISVPKEPFCGL
jgi:dipeptidyl aminopeptidase/acylaminoacyl peptidase/DNA-binding CsgD family transcriptional regulator